MRVNQFLEAAHKYLDLLHHILINCQNYHNSHTLSIKADERPGIDISSSRTRYFNFASGLGYHFKNRHQSNLGIQMTYQTETCRYSSAQT
ncbi:MAG: hypothetical protein CM15mP4_3730 [Candidatus Neomarinimicrobiota bacterium]|nr:MAG: hypothetical protein CM15mP4_3730 [Candidatus Neomarinimicrobiota bacterium]